MTRKSLFTFAQSILHASLPLRIGTSGGVSVGCQPCDQLAKTKRLLFPPRADLYPCTGVYKIQETLSRWPQTNS